MFTKILVPVDLAHADRLEKAIDAAADLAKSYNAELVYVGATTSQPSEVARGPEEYERKLKDFAAKQGRAHGVEASAIKIPVHDPTTEVDDVLLRTIRDEKPDLVVMASHIPGAADYIFEGNAAKVAAHAPISVFVVR